MPSYTWDPTTGQAVDSYELASQHEAYLDQSDNDYQAHNDKLRNETAAYLAGDTQRGHQFDPVDAQDYHLHQLQQELATAQAKGDYITEQRVIAVLDGLTSGQLQVKGSGKPASRAQEGLKPEERVSESVTGPQSAETFLASEANERVRNDYGSETVDAVHAFMNESLSEKELQHYLTSDNADDQQILFEISMSRYEAAQAGMEANPIGVGDQAAARLTEQYGTGIAPIVELSNAVKNGELTQAEAIGRASRDPQLLALAARAISEGQLQWGV